MATDAPLIEGQSFVRKTLTTLIMLSIFAGLVVLGWFANEENRNPVDYTNLPVIKADKSPFKIKPTDPGGMKVDNTEIKLYDEITTDINPKRTDVIDLSDAKMAPPPEEPIQIEEATITVIPPKHEEKNTPNSSIKTAKLKEVPLKMSPEMRALAEKIANQAKEIEEPKKVEKLQEESFNKVLELSSVEPASDQPEIVPMHKPDSIKQIFKRIKATKTHSYDPRYKRVILSGVPTKPSGTSTQAVAVKKEPTIPTIKRVTKVNTIVSNIRHGSVLIQLGSYQSSASVKKGWEVLKKRYPKELSALALSIKTVDLGPKGVYYRLLAGPFRDKDDAINLCKTLNVKGQGCFVAR